MGASRVVNEFAKLFFENTKNSTTFGRCLKNVKLISAEGGNCRAEFTVDEEHTNLGGSLHGGFTSTLIDCITTYALVSHGSGTPGVSVNLHVTFMKAAFPGDNLIIDAKTIRAGKTLAYLEAELKMKEGGAIVARGQHTKFIGQ